jgi:acetyl/propionyl-CoA carboxylase alpha subunit
VLAGSLYWWHLLSPIRARLRLDGMGPVVYMASTKLFVGALGMGLAFAPSALYPYYVHHVRVWGISAISDQSIAGLIMAVEQSMVMGIALVTLFVRALAESERAQQRRERYEAIQPTAPMSPQALAASAKALQDAAVTGDRADQDRLARDLRAGEDDALAQLRTVAHDSSIAEHDRPH